MKSFVYLILSGLVSGVFGGMGMGGGTLLIPVLTIFLNFTQKNAQGINLLVFIPMAVVSLIIHIKNKLVDFKVGVPIMIVGIMFSIGGSLLANSLSNENLKKIFGWFLLLVGIYQAIQVLINIRKSKFKKNSLKFKFRMYLK